MAHLAFVVDGVELDMEAVTRVTAVSLSRCKQRFCLFGRSGFDTPFLEAGDRHCRMEHFEIAFLFCGAHRVPPNARSRHDAEPTRNGNALLTRTLSPGSLVNWSVSVAPREIGRASCRESV